MAQPSRRKGIVAWYRDLAIAKKLVAMVAVMAVAMALLVAVAWGGLFIIKGARAYVEGEGLWSKGQKDAVYYLTQYAELSKPEYLDKFREAIAYPLGDRKARLEMAKPDYDHAVVTAGFLEGGLTREDIPSIIFLYRHLRDVPQFAAAIDIWERADAFILQLDRIARQIEAAENAGGLGEAQRRAFGAQIEAINLEVTPIEREFSRVMGDGARLVERVALSVIVTAAALLLAIGTLTVWLLSRQIHSQIKLLKQGVARTDQGDLNSQIQVLSGDELGDLTDAFNHMVSNRKHALDALEKEGEFRDVLLENLSEGIVACDEHGHVSIFNRATRDILGLPAHPIARNRWSEYSHFLHADGTLLPTERLPLYRAFQGELVENFELVVVHSSGERRAVLCSGGPLMTAAGKKIGAVVVLSDITQRKQTEATILHMAHHDALTGLPNRLSLLNHLNQAIDRARDAKRQIAVLMLDLDHFKRVNDTLGHHYGDDLLLAVAKRIQSHMRGADTVARLGGDEFVVVLNDFGTQEDLQNATERIAHSVGLPININDHELLITPSIGGSIYPRDGADAASLIKHADTAMYAAKNSGRSNIQWFDQAMSEQASQKLTLIGAIQGAIDGNQFYVHYQPEIDVASGNIVGVEALIRWQHPYFGNILPPQFIPLAEETGHILPIGEWVLRTACYQIMQIEREHGARLMLAVNVSPRQFQHSGWVDIVIGAIHESGIHPAQLELEITEGLLMQNPDESVEILKRLRKLGVRIVIDDFGTGYSSLSYLTQFPIDKIKIDRSFVAELTEPTSESAIIDAIISMAHSLKVAVIAEGVETETQLNYLRKHGCDQAQGFYFSKAVSTTGIAALLQHL